MVDLFEYPVLRSKDEKEQIKELQDYLVQFKETLEFTLRNISQDNLSKDLKDKIDSLEKHIEKYEAEREDVIQQIINK